MIFNVNFYGLLVKVISSKRIIFFCYHLFREENILIDFLLKNLQNNNLLAKHDPSVHLIGLYTFGLTWTRYWFTYNHTTSIERTKDVLQMYASYKHFRMFPSGNYVYLKAEVLILSHFVSGNVSGIKLYLKKTVKIISYTFFKGLKLFCIICHH